MIFTSGVILLPAASARQQDSVRVLIERNLEWAIEEIDPEESGLDPEELIEYLVELANNPLNINRAGVDDLIQIPGLNFRLAQNIVRYRSEERPFSTVGDLIDVSGIGNVTLERISPYLSAGSALERSRDLYLNPRYWIASSRFEAFSRVQQVLQKQEGYRRGSPDGGYAGSPARYYQRFRYTSDHLSFNFTQDKDPGETLSGPAGFDFNSWHIALTDNGNLKNLVVGDYSVAFGQGLLLWSGGTFGKGRSVLSAANKNERGIRPFTSSQEAAGFRGIAATYGNRLQVTGFYSRRKRTASEVDETHIRFPTQSGYHRTANEIARRNNVKQETAGGRVRLRIPYGFTGISAFYNYFDRPVAAGTQPYQVFDFEGKVRKGASADYRLLFGPALFFGEAAYTDNGGYGIVGGTELGIGPATGAVFTYRYYDKRFQSFFGSGFGEQSGPPGNEEGFYAGIRHELTQSVRISAYLDQYRFPAPRFGTSRPTSGHDWLGLIEYSLGNNLSLYGLVRFKTKEDEFDSTDELGREIRLPGDHKRTGARFQAEYQVHPKVRLRSRFDMVRARAPAGEPQWGYLVFQDIRILPRPSLTIDARITLFDSDDFESRLYQFENGLLYTLSNTMLFDQGQRMYLVLNYEPAPWLEFWLKISTTLYENRNIISSGLQEIEGNRRSDIGVQARVRF